MNSSATSIILIAQHMPQVYVCLSLLPVLSQQFAHAELHVLTTATHFQHFRQFQHSQLQARQPCNMQTDLPLALHLHTAWSELEQMPAPWLCIYIGHSYFLSDDVLLKLSIKAAHSKLVWLNAHFEPEDWSRFASFRANSGRTERGFAELFLLICYEDQRDARSLATLGLQPQQLHCSPSAKYACAAASAWQIQRAEQIFHGMRKAQPPQAPQPVLIAASIAVGEEISLFARTCLALRAHFPDLLFVLAPRCPENTDEFTRVLDEYGVSYQRSSETIQTFASILLLDELGILKGFYAFADIAIVARSFYTTASGGSNFLEPAAAALPVVCGPYMGSFQTVLSEFLQQQALIQLDAATDLPQCLLDLLNAPKIAEGYAQRAQAIYKQKSHALSQNITYLAQLCTPTCI